jgi:WD40 repeat protein/DNA-binding SARP family transcriptional activator
VEFRLLGPLEVVGDGGRALALGTGRRRALLAYLLLKANEPVASDRLVDAMWGETPPATAAQMIQNQVWALRRELGANGRLETLGSAYRLNVARGERDLDQFEDLVAAARDRDAPQAATSLRKALALWRGPALADLTYEPFAQAEIARLEELRWAAFEACAEAELALGRHAEIVPELEHAVAEQPLRERVQSQLMLALYRSGRQADALEAYRRARQALVDEVGVEPGPELRALQAAILAQDPALDAPPTLPEALAGGSPVLAGREGELEALRERMASGAAYVITGPAGIGKTRLAAELAREAVRRRIDVVYTADPVEATGRSGLVILDDADAVAVPEPGPGALLLVLRRGGYGDLVLGPLDRAGVVQIAALYLAPEIAESHADALMTATGGNPLAVHRTAAEWGRTEAATLVAASAERAAADRGELRAAEADLAGKVVGLQAAEERIAVADEPPESAVCPYLGLTTFDADQAAYFFGRERLVAEIVARLVGAPLLAIVGPSGSGKSSVMRAGLLPALAGGVLPGSESWPRVLMRPGAHPHEKLARLLPNGERTVLAVDQFEELFTACDDEGERAAFVDALVAAAHDGVTVVLAVRADFYGRCAVYGDLAALVGANHVLVGPMRDDELRRAIELPARRAGLTVEPALTAALIEDVREAPGGLPLLSAALLELWRERDGRVLRRSVYDRTGGVRGAVARLAEQTYGRLSEQDRDEARRVLVRLADAEHGTAFVRRRVPLEEPGPESAAALAALADSRLITVDDDAIEVAHEALLREWPRLRAWLEDDAEGRRLQQHLINAARDWEAGGQDPAELYRGARLSAALDWVAGHERDLNERERAFVDESRAAAEREGERQRRANRRLRMLILGLAGVLVVAVAAGAVALHQRGQARGAAVMADAQRLGAEGLVEDQLDRALLLARTGVALDDTAATRSSLLSVLLRDPPVLGVIDRAYRTYTVAISPDDRVLATGDETGAVTFYDVATHQQLGRYLVDGGLVQNVRFSPDGRTVAIGSIDPDDPIKNAVADVIDARTYARRFRVRLEPFRDATDFVVADPLFVRGGDLVVNEFSGTGDEPSRLYLVDGDSGAVDGRLSVDRSYRLSATVDGRDVFVTNAGSTWRIATHPLRITRKYAAGGSTGAPSPDGRMFAYGTEDGRLHLLDLRSGATRTLQGRGKGGVDHLVFAPDGRTVVVTNGDAKVRAWNVAGGALARTFSGHTGSVNGLAVSADSRMAVSASNDGRVIEWDLAGDRRLDRPFPIASPYRVDQTPRGIATSPDGRTVALTGSDGSVELIDTRTLELRETIHALAGQASGVAFSPDGRRLAVCGAEGQVTVWDARTLRQTDELHGLRGGICQSVAFSPDGTRLAGSETDTRGPRLRVWNVADGTLTPYRSSSPASEIAYSPDGRLLAVAAQDSGTEIRDASTGALVKRLKTGDGGRSVAFSPDRRLLATGLYNGSVVFYSTADWRPVGRPLQGHTARVTYAEFSPDSRTLVTSGADGTVRLWDVASQKPIGAPLEDFPPSAFMAVALTPGGRYAFAAPPHGPGIRFDMSPAAWNAHACLVAGRDITPREWADAVPGRGYQHVCGR